MDSLELATRAQTINGSPLTFRPDLQGLRAIAVVLVILTHAGLNLLPGGFIGVDVFFVLSGYLITGLLLHELDQTGRIDFLRFYSKRLKRLLPALLTMLIVIYVTAFILLPVNTVHAQMASMPYAVTWTSNLFFAFRDVGYFDELANNDLLLHTWSLGVEEQFYLFWPLLLLVLFRIGNIGRQEPEVNRRTMTYGLLVVLAMSFALSLHWSFSSPQLAFYMMPSRIWQLALGGIIYVAYSSVPADRADTPSGRHRIIGFAALGAGLACIVGSAVGLDNDRAYPGLWGLIPTAGAALVIASGYYLKTGTRSLLANPILVWLGDRSYSLYLWHWPIFGLGFSLGLRGQALPSLGLILLALLAAILSYRTIELPFWKGRFSKARPHGNVAVSLATMAGVIIAFHAIQDVLPKPAPTDMGIRWRMDLPVIYRMNCDAWYANAMVAPCEFGPRQPKKTVVLLGDSVMSQWFSMVPAIFKAPDWRTVVLTKSSCPMVDEDIFYERIGKIYQVCTDWRRAVLDRLDKLKPDLLILGSAATYKYTNAQWTQGSRRILQRVSRAAGEVIVIPGTPHLNFDGPSCVVKHLLPDGSYKRDSCNSGGSRHLTNRITGYLRKAAQGIANVRVLNLNDLVCPNGTCKAVNANGIVVFRDSQHLTNSFVKANTPAIRTLLYNSLQSLGAPNLIDNGQHEERTYISVSAKNPAEH